MAEYEKTVTPPHSHGIHRDPVNQVCRGDVTADRVGLIGNPWGGTVQAIIVNEYLTGHDAPPTFAIH
jgi:hypothetical protein